MWVYAAAIRRIVYERVAYVCPMRPTMAAIANSRSGEAERLVRVTKRRRPNCGRLPDLLS